MGSSVGAQSRGWRALRRSHRSAAPAADIGGWLADRQKAREIAAARAADDTCPQLIARAAAEGGAPLGYRAALCYVGADPPDALVFRRLSVEAAAAAADDRQEQA